jgi:hypothetical protein
MGDAEGSAAIRAYVERSKALKVVQAGSPQQDVLEAVVRGA